MCGLCPRNCMVNREVNAGICRMGGKPVVAKAFLHMWEEPCISGTKGSGTVFFSGCNLKCVFCQNAPISQGSIGKELSTSQLAEVFLNLQKKGAHNINLVNPTHFIKQIKDSIEAAEGLKIPVVYNSNGYESIEGLRTLEGIVDIYLPDLKYFSDNYAVKYSSANDYFKITSSAILEMYRQVGGYEEDAEGIMKKGLIIRHLILPGMTGESIEILKWIKNNLPPDIVVSLMSQYIPYHKAEQYPEINRRITRREYEKAADYFLKLGFEHGYVQERDSAEETYIPDFDLEGITFR